MCLLQGELEATDIEEDDESLAVLSRLCFELSEKGTGDRRERFHEAQAAYDLVLGLAWEPDHFDERQEVLCDLALVAWRNARLGCSSTVAAKWQRKHQTAVLGATVLRKSLEHLLSRWTRTPAADLVKESVPDVRTLFALTALMWELLNEAPAAALNSVLAVRERLASMEDEIFEADEKAFLLGLTALLASGAYRHVGELATSEMWVNKAEALIGPTSNPDPLLVKCAYARLALGYDLRRYEMVLAQLPSVRQRFRELEMEEDATLCDFMQALALKGLGDTRSAFAKFSSLRQSLSPTDNVPLLGYVVENIGAILSSEGRYAEAFEQYRTALGYLQKSNRPWMVAILKGDIGETLRDCGQLGGAIEAFRESVSDYADLGMKTFVAYIRIVLAETLLAAGRPREAELEVLAALPTIEEQSLVKDGVAAVALLRESVRRCNTDRDALRRVSEQMRGGAR
jgi:tetratricopeptide (TPR) repeat protein